MQNKILAFLSVPLLTFIFTNESHQYTGDKFTVHYETKNGMLDGDYVSYYNNGNKKAEGHFKTNNRSGEWKIWDSLGNLKCKRTYQNNLSFTQSFPSSYSLALPEIKNGYYEYSQLEEKNILIEHRSWRKISSVENPSLFTKQLSDTISAALLQGKILIFDEEEFRSIVPASILTKKLGFDAQLIAFKLKEDFFIDGSRKIAETRIVGICPVYKNSNDTLEAGWIFYPALRKKLSNIPMLVKDMPLIKTAEDILYFRSFSSELEKENNPGDLPLKSYCKTSHQLKAERERIELDLVELNNNYLSGYLQQWLDKLPISR